MKPSGVVARYMAVVAAAGLLGVAALAVVEAAPPSALSLLLGVALLIAELCQVMSAGGEAVSMGSLVVLVALWLLGPAVPVWAEVVGWCLVGAWRRSPGLVVAFNLGQTVLAVLAAAAAFRLGGGDWGLPLASGDSVVPYLASAAAFGLVNAALVAAAFALYKRVPFREQWRDYMVADSWRLAVSWLLALGVYVLFTRHDYPPAALAVFPVLAVIHQVGTSVWTRRLRQRAVERFLRTLHADLEVVRRAELLVRLVTNLAESLGVGGRELDNLRHAALLHEAGGPRPLGVGESEPAPDLLVRHALASAREVARIVVLEPVARILRHHHEHWDGTGGPDGLRGTAIPLPSRVLAVAEAYLFALQRWGDADAAWDAVLRRAGSRYDPQVVEALAGARDLVGWAAEPRLSVVGELAVAADQLRRFVREEGCRSGGRGVGFHDDHLLRQAAGGVVALSHFARVINATLRPDQVAERVLDTFLEVLGGRVLWLVPAGPPAVLRVAGVRNAPPDLVGGELDLNRPPFRQLVEQDKALVIRLEPDQGPSWLLGGQRRWILAVPLVARGQLLAAVVVVRDGPPPYPFTQGNLLDVVASQAALSLDNARLFEQVQLRLQELTSLKRFQDLVFEQVGTGIVAADATGTVTLANRTAAEILRRAGWPGCQLPPPRPLGAGNPCDSMLLEQLTARHPLPPRTWELEAEDGSPLVVTAQAFPLVGHDGERAGAVVLLRDVTQERELEQRARRSERLAAVGQLAAGAAHEIRNPLTAIKGFIQLIGRKLEGEAAGYMDIVLQEIDRIEGIVNDLLLLARPPKPRLRPVDVGGLLARLVEMIRLDEAARGCTVELAVAGPLPPVVADEAQLRQVFLNLVRNGLDAMPAGGVLRVRALYDRATDTVQVEVEDRGPGIPPEHLNRIFDPFFSTKEGGTGLGLAVSYGIVRNHGGHIDVDSEPGCGTRMRVVLPVAGPAGQPARPEGS
ncbi:multi-sensor signal transduction histidine kinase [Thermaerobacter marianensis DSM 12885]|uniref:histidine kinase n=1 Tax=Thermaerobacter marianensis (strain ATCC 700841 / DSM 12885 / JCM 10246 / 7p75a) TaxID=644966 RepID=E6SME9_THEM7|nr:ATP-binding protein [Thermaerobacter marianensis]ADU50409.1 multi-sensor signal transduction histidine kinase [Thermaerobacter marianensis DSM 12885]